MANRAGSYIPKGGHLATQTELNRTKTIMNKHKVKHHRNYDTKTGNRNRDHIKTTALERSEKITLC